MENIKKSYKNNKFKIPASTWNNKFELPNGSYSISDIQNYFVYIIKKHVTLVNNPSINININKTERRVTFKIKTRYYLEPPEAIKLNGSIKKIKKKTKKKLRKCTSSRNYENSVCPLQYFQQ